MFDKVDDSEMQKLSAELDSMSKALDDMTFVATTSPTQAKLLNNIIAYGNHSLSYLANLSSFHERAEIDAGAPYITQKKYTTNKQFFESFGAELSAHKDCEQLCVIEKQEECDSLNWKLDDCYDD